MVNSCFCGVSCMFVCVLISRRHEFGLTRVYLDFARLSGDRLHLATGTTNDEGKKTIPEVIRKRLFVQEVQVDEAVDFFFYFLNS